MSLSQDAMTYLYGALEEGGGAPDAEVFDAEVRCKARLDAVFGPQ